MWFWLALAALLCWSGSDLFSKIGCSNQDDRTSHLKMVIMVGLVMGVHAAYEIFFGGVTVTWDIIWTYLPVSLLYISSMTLGYIGLRYIELSISSPICNSSGALAAILYLISGERLEKMQYVGVFLVCLGVISLAIVDAREDEELRARRQEASNKKYAKSALAILLPVLYCILDAAGSFADGLVLDKLALTIENYEASANVAYELTFLFAAAVSLIIVCGVKKEKLTVRSEGPKLVGACFETAGQFAYIFALSANPAAAAPMISSYCAASVLWSRIFLKEKLSWKHYATIAVAVLGIVILGVYDA